MNNDDTNNPTNDQSSEMDDLRARAERAERQATELESQLTELNTQLEQAQQSIAHTERNHQLDLALTSAGAIDLDTARLLAQRIAHGNTDATPTDILNQLTREKPFLFRKTSSAHSAMSPRADNTSAPAITAAHHAATTGDRTALLDYLRARRTT